MTDLETFLEVLEDTVKENGGFPEEFHSDEAFIMLNELAINCNAHFDNGISKAVIVFDNDDCVLKIPLNGQINNVYDSEIHTCEETFCPFDGAFVSRFDPTWDYCAVEQERYKEAEQAGVAKYFAETALLRTIGGYPVYIQPKVVTYSEARSDECLNFRNSAEERKKTTAYCHEHGYRCFADDWLTDFRNYYGEEQLNKLLEFIRCECIGDLHSENIGYLGEAPLILDYSDFNE